MAEGKGHGPNLNLWGERRRNLWLDDTVKQPVEQQQGEAEGVDVVAFQTNHENYRPNSRCETLVSHPQSVR